MASAGYGDLRPLRHSGHTLAAASALARARAAHDLRSGDFRAHPEAENTGGIFEVRANDVLVLSRVSRKEKGHSRHFGRGLPRIERCFRFRPLASSNST
jgi:hypothetical protein